MKILHISAHLGGGVGRAISSFVTYKPYDSTYKNEIMLLEQPIETQYYLLCKNNGVTVSVINNITEVKEKMQTADLVILHWWHHPRMAMLLSNFPDVPIRLILWCHISGCTYPMLPGALAKLPHKIFFTTRYSYDNPYWASRERQDIIKKAIIAYGLGNMDHLPVLPKKKHKGIQIGYLGTLHYSKLNPDYVYYCKAVAHMTKRFIMVGQNKNCAQLLHDIEKLKMEDKFSLYGYMANVQDAYAEFDIFGYLLNPWHYGTTENSILEAMHSGLPVVALRQSAEQYLISHLETGLLAESISHYADLMRFLIENPLAAKRIGQQAAEYVQEEFNYSKNFNRIITAFAEVMSLEKQTFNFCKVFGKKPFEWFLSCLGEDYSLFSRAFPPQHGGTLDPELLYWLRCCRPVLRAPSKSSLFHFAHLFPEDEILQYWSKIIME